jgi:hypothetical protein
MDVSVSEKLTQSPTVIKLVDPTKISTESISLKTIESLDNE